MSRFILPGYLIVLILVIGACGQSGPSIVYTSDQDGNMEIYSIQPDSKDQINLTNSPEDEFSPIISPDRNLIAFQSGSSANIAIHVIKSDGTERRAVTIDSGWHGTHTWGPGSDRIAFVRKKDDTNEVLTAHLGGDGPTKLTPIEANEVGDWSGDGDAVVFAVLDGKHPGVFVRNPDGVNEMQLTESLDHSAVWSPDSKRIAFISERDGNSEIYVMARDGEKEHRLTENEESEYDLSWAPDGKRLLFVSDRDGNPEIYTMEDTGAKQTRLTYNNVVDHQPVWSPDGRRIAFVSVLDGDAEIFIMKHNGEDQVRLTSNEAEDTNPSW